MELSFQKYDPMGDILSPYHTRKQVLKPELAELPIQSWIALLPVPRWHQSQLKQHRTALEMPLDSLCSLAPFPSYDIEVPTAEESSLLITLKHTHLTPLTSSFG